MSAVYAVLFEKQFGRSEYEIAIGEACLAQKHGKAFSNC